MQMLVLDTSCAKKSLVACIRRDGIENRDRADSAGLDIAGILRRARGLSRRICDLSILEAKDLAHVR